MRLVISPHRCAEYPCQHERGGRGQVLELHIICAAVHDLIRPVPKLPSRPLKTVVPVSECSGGQPVEQHVVFRIGVRDEDGLGFRSPEDGSLNSLQPRRVDVFDTSIAVAASWPESRLSL